MNRTKNAMRNLMSGALAKAVSIIFPFIIRTIIIKKLGAEYLGLNSLFVSILQVLSLAELGFGNAIIFSMYKPIVDKDLDKLNALYLFYRKVYRIVGTVMLAAGLLIMPFLPNLISGEYPGDINIYIIYLIFLFNTVISYWLFAYKDSLLQANQRYDISTNITVISNALMYLLQIVVLLTVNNYYAYILLLPVATVINNIIKSICVDRMYPHIICAGKLSAAEKNELYKKIFGLLLFKICGICRNSFDSIIISSFLGLVILTQYQNYFIVITSLVSITAIVVDSIISGVGNSIAAESKEKNYRDFNTLFFMLNWLAGWCTVCLVCLYQPFIELWLGKDYLLSDRLAFLLGIYFYVQQIGNVGYIYRTAAGLWWENKLCPLVESLANLLLNVLLVKFWGVEGVVMATIVTMLCINVPWSSLVLFRKYFLMRPYKYWGKILINAALVLLIAAATWSICNCIHYGGIVGLLIKALICLVFPNVLFYFFFAKSKDLPASKKLVQDMIRSVRK